MADGLSNIFRRGLISLSKASKLPSIKDETQDLVDSALSDLRTAYTRVADLSLFSSNETLDDISTRDLVYLLVPFTLAEAENRARAKDHDSRLARLTKAERNYQEFVQHLEHCDIVSRDEQVLHRKNASAIADASQRREMKIKQYKAEKDIRSKITAVHQRTRQTSLDMQSDFDLIVSLLPPLSGNEMSSEEDSDVEDAQREATLLLLRLLYAQAYAQLDHLVDELQLLKSAPPPEPHHPEEKRDPNDISWRLDMPRSNLSRDGPLLDPKGRPLQPFTILASDATQRARLQAQVFQADHRLPTMTIDEYLEIERERGNILSGGGAASLEQPTSKEQLAIDSEKDGTAFAEAKAEEKRQKDEEWARFTDTNPRGAGNTMNRG